MIRAARTFAVLALGVSLTRCQGERSAAPTQNHATIQVDAVMQNHRLPHAAAGMEWVGDLHNRVLEEWMDGRPVWRDLPAAEACARLVGVIRSHFPEVKRLTGVADGAAFERALSESQSRLGCARVGPAAGSAALPTALVYGDINTDTGTVTGAYEPYANQIASAVANAATADIAEVAVDRVLIQASHVLPSADFAVLSAIAGVAASSAGFWEGYQETLDGLSLSIFRRTTFSWRNFAAADIGGAISTVGFLRLVGAVHPYLIAAGLFGGAAVASGYYAYQNS